MKNLKFPSGWFNQSTFKQENGISQGCQKNLLKNLARNGSVETRIAPKGSRLIKLYRQVRQPESVRESIYSPSLLHDLFGFMGMNEMTVLTTETQPV